MTAGEPFLTWNLFATAIGIPALGWWLSNLIKKRDDLAQENMRMWQEGAKQRSDNMCAKIEGLDRRVIALRADLSNKVDNHICDKQHSEVERKIEKIESKIKVWT